MLPCFFGGFWSRLVSSSSKARIKRIVKLAAGVFAYLLYVWFAAARYAPRIKRRKQARRAP